MVGTLQLLRWERLCNVQLTEVRSRCFLCSYAHCGQMDQVMELYYNDEVINIENELRSIR